MESLGFNPPYSDDQQLSPPAKVYALNETKSYPAYQLENALSNMYAAIFWAGVFMINLIY